MTKQSEQNEGQAATWNGAAGQAWVDAQSLLEDIFRPVEELLVAPLGSPGVQSVLDVGCGTGGTTRAAARRIGTAARCVGVDISSAMIAAARARPDREDGAVTFVEADAQRHVFEAASFDAVQSRFGVMFFDDMPAAFANLRRAVRVGGGLRALTWRGAEENPFMTTAERAAAPLLPSLPRREPDAPGQFGLADAARTRRFLGAGGWSDIAIEPVDITCAFPQAELDFYLSRLGPVGRALADLDERTRASVVDRVRPAFGPYVTGRVVRFEAALWLVTAVAR